MEQLSGDTVHPHLRRVLKTYQTAAVRSLKGPKRLATALYLSDEVTGNGSPDMDDYRKGMVTTKKLPSEKGMEYDPFLAPPPFPIQQIPIFTPVDCSRSEKSDTTLEGETIACFSVGGEKRLCLPQILNTVLREFSLQDINAVCDELHIFCSRCIPKQLDTLKVLGILPLSAPSCGLITKTDAERLCNALTYRKAEKSTEPPTPNSFKIYHECFGKCKGVFNPELYSSPNVKCVQCVDCRCMFTPQKFVCHSHKALENRTCHWGFDSSNWRAYLLLAKDQESKDKLPEVLEQIKARFDVGNKYKRKQSPDRDPIDQKRVKNEESWVEHVPGMRSSSAFRPWSPGMLSALKDGKITGTPPALMRDGLPRMLPPYLHTGPPVLLNPERVVPHTETSRFEHHYAPPNVALAPEAYKSKEDEKGEGGMGALQKLAEAAASRLSPPGKEYELSTDTEGSSCGQISPSDCPERKVLESFCPQSSLEAELIMVRQALDGNVTDSKEARDKFLHEFSKLRAVQQEYQNNILQMVETLKEENASLNQGNAEAKEKCRKLRKEMECLKVEHRCQLQEQRDGFVNNTETLNHTTEKVKDSSCCMQITKELQARLCHYESAYDELQKENCFLHDELLRHGVTAMCMAVPARHLINGSLSGGTSPLSSPPSSAGSPNCRLERLLLPFKKEKDI